MTRNWEQVIVFFAIVPLSHVFASLLSTLSSTIFLMRKYWFCTYWSLSCISYQKILTSHMSLTTSVHLIWIFWSFQWQLSSHSINHSACDICHWLLLIWNCMYNCLCTPNVFEFYFQVNLCWVQFHVQINLHHHRSFLSNLL